MNCCNHNDRPPEKGKKHGIPGHMLLMVLCCAAPFLLAVALPAMTFLPLGIRGALASLSPFLCPLMMLGMVPMMLGGRKKTEQESPERSCLPGDGEDEEFRRP